MEHVQRENHGLSQNGCFSNDLPKHIGSEFTDCSELISIFFMGV